MCRRDVSSGCLTRQWLRPRRTSSRFGNKNIYLATVAGRLLGPENRGCEACDAWHVSELVGWLVGGGLRAVVVTHSRRQIIIER